MKGSPPPPSGFGLCVEGKPPRVSENFCPADGGVVSENLYVFCVLKQMGVSFFFWDTPQKETDGRFALFLEEPNSFLELVPVLLFAFLSAGISELRSPVCLGYGINQLQDLVHVF